MANKSYSKWETIILVPTISFRSKTIEAFRAVELILALTLRDIKIRYSVPSLGILWVILQPLCMTSAIIVAFSLSGKAPQGLHHIPFILSGLAVWNYFSSVIERSSSMIVSSRGLISKVYFPKIALPLSVCLGALIDYFATSAIVLVAARLFAGSSIATGILGVALISPFVVLSAMGVGLWVSALTAQFHDFRYILSTLLQFGLYASPVIYESANIPRGLTALFFLNPNAGAIEIYRYFVLSTGCSMFVIVSIISSLAIFITGLAYFWKIEDRMSDIT